jgi:hypothetical protein
MSVTSTFADATVFNVHQAEEGVVGIMLLPVGVPGLDSTFKFWNQPQNTAMIYTSNANYFNSTPDPDQTIIRCISGNDLITPQMMAIDTSYSMKTRDTVRDFRNVFAGQSFVYLTNGPNSGSPTDSGDALTFQFVNSAPEPPPTNYGIFVGGQSNAVGWNTGPISPSLDAFDNRIFEVSLSGNANVATLPIESGQDLSSFSFVASRVGFDFAFCKQTLQLLRPQDKLYIVNRAVAGASVSSWQNVNNDYLTIALASYANAISTYSLTPAAFLWHQGESDCVNQFGGMSVNPIYQTELTNTFTAIRAVMSCPIFSGQLWENLYTHNSANNAIRSVHNNVENLGVSNVHLVDMSSINSNPAYSETAVGFANPDSTPLHYNAAGQRLIGGLYQAKFASVNTITHSL